MDKTITVLGLPALLLMLAGPALAHTVAVRNVEELYRAVNQPGNAGATLALNPGTYVLTVTDPAGAARPKGGRLELQKDMSMRGRIGDRDAVTIDASNLPAGSFPATTNGVATGPSAAVRLGLGRNELEWLTVRGAVNAQANIDTGLQPLDAADTWVRIAHVDSTGSTRGLNVLNFGAQASGQTIEADIIDCRFYDNDLNLSEGVRIGNFQGARGSKVNARMAGNFSWGQKQGRLIVNNRANDSTVNVASLANRFFDNGGGTIIVGGLSSNNTRADGNTIRFTSIGDQFTGNRAESEFDHGGLVVLGAEDISAAGGASNNSVEVTLLAARLRDNDTADLVGIGARALSEATAVNNQYNQVTIRFPGPGMGHGPRAPVESIADSVPANPNFGNSVRLVR